MTRGVGVAVLWVSMTSMVGCSSNAVLEMFIDLPPRPADAQGELYALTQVRRADAAPFDGVEWLGASDVDAILLSDTTTEDHISVESFDDSIDLHVRVTFCGDPSCAAVGRTNAPQLWFRLEHPFWLGERTQWDHEIASVPTGVPVSAEIVGRCRIRGCASADSETTNFCRTGETHACE